MLRFIFIFHSFKRLIEIKRKRLRFNHTYFITSPLLWFIAYIYIFALININSKFKFCNWVFDRVFIGSWSHQTKYERQLDLLIREFYYTCMSLSLSLILLNIVFKRWYFKQWLFVEYCDQATSMPCWTKEFKMWITRIMYHSKMPIVWAYTTWPKQCRNGFPNEVYPIAWTIFFTWLIPLIRDLHVQRPHIGRSPLELARSTTQRKHMS